jgi:para-nitrobenzyl esterase
MHCTVDAIWLWKYFVVTVNYRVGPLGFLALSSAGIEGNFVIQDIILPL